MAKVMLVEDDNNLREIYEARLAAEGYQIVSAPDGEAALALAVKEKPDLIIADIMMPKVSGFDMLDILRTTPETKNTKIIMMTALSQAEDKSRAEQLGADRYLVKSQVTLEDVVNVAHELLNESSDPDKIAGVEIEKPNNQAAVSTQSSTTLASSVPVATPAPDTPITPSTATSKPTLANNTDTPQTNLSAPVSSQPTEDSTQPPKPSRKTIAITSFDGDKPTDNTAQANDAKKLAQSANAQPNDTNTNTDVEKSSEPAKKEENLEEKVGSIIPDNPTITDSAEPEKSAEIPAEQKPNNQPEYTHQKDNKEQESLANHSDTNDSASNGNAKNLSDAEQTIANALDNLTPENSKQKIEDTTTSNEKQDEKSSDSPTSTGEESMKHTKVIEPLDDFSTKGPDLNELLAKEGITMDEDMPQPPTAHTVITPDGNTLQNTAPNPVMPDQNADSTPQNTGNLSV